MSLGSSSELFFGGSAAAGTYEIERSLRFNSADSAYLNRTPASAGNRQTWTWAAWVKRSTLSSQQIVMNAGTAGLTDRQLYFRLVFQADDKLALYFGGGIGSTNFVYNSTVYRDTSAWYHIVFAVDLTQAAIADAGKLYVNGVKAEDPSDTGSVAYSPLSSSVNNNVNHELGRHGTGTQYFDGYLADVHLIDGQALDPTSFGKFDTNGVWQPKAYSGSYGTNGFHLPFSDNSTAAALGTDTSGNSNTWTVNNFSVTPGAGNDSLVDTPTNYGTDTGAGGEVRGNYCTWNPLDKDADVTLTNGNLDMTQTAPGGVKGTIHVSSGKWYWEIAKTTTANQVYGIATSAAVPSTYVGGYAGSAGVASAGTLYSSGNFTRVNGATTIGPFSSGDIIGLALDLDSSPKTLKFYRNGTLETGNHYEITETGTLTPVVGTNTGDYVLPGSANFGQRPFAYTAPSGFKALCTTNLPDPTIADGSTVMDAVTYLGNGGTQTISGLGFSPDWVWIKSRTTDRHIVTDIVRGVTNTLNTDDSRSEPLATEASQVTAYTSTGFTVGSNGNVNGSSVSFVAWTWDAGSSTVTNNAGSISSQVRANPSAGFSVVTYTGTGATASVGHGLNALPQMIIVKRRDSTGNWAVYHRTQGANTYLLLNSGAGPTSLSNYWQYTPSPGNPTSTWFGIIGGNDVNVLNGTYVAYCFASVSGYSAFGSYAGNGSADGPFIYTGFRPRWIMIKSLSATANEPWMIQDTARSPVNPSTTVLFANLTGGDNTSSIRSVDFLSNGFKLRTSDAGHNGPSDSYVWAAFAENPFQSARAR